ncbi:hypothetical protein D3C83_143330 [compost metagenome]
MQVVRGGRVAPAKVETGVRTASRVEIVSGLAEGDVVLLVRGIADGARVRLRESGK